MIAGTQEEKRDSSTAQVDALGGGGVKERLAFAEERVSRGGERRGELARGQGIERAETLRKLGVGQTAFAVEAAKKILRVSFPFLSVALLAAGHEVAIGAAP